MSVSSQIFLSAQAQQAWAEQLAPTLPNGLVLFLQGELGSGKTTLSQGLLRGLGFTGEVNSPTYALMHEYPTPQGLVLHVDAYRIRHPQELWEMGLEDYASRCRLIIIEWGQAFYSEFPEGWIFALEYLETEAAMGRTLQRIR